MAKISQPKTRADVKERSQPLLLEGKGDDERAALCIHGFTGTPYEVHLLAHALHDQGLHVSAPLLAGHGFDLKTLRATGHTDWLKSAEDALHELYERTRRATGKRPKLLVAGLSMGGLIAMDLASRYPRAAASSTGNAEASAISIDALCVMAAPLFLPPDYEKGIRKLAASRFLKKMFIPKFFGSDVRERNLPRPPTTPAGMPVTSLAELLDLMAHVKARLAEVRQPTLLAHGALDHTADYACMKAIAEGLRTAEDQLHLLSLPKSYHLLPVDVEREILFQAVTEHAKRYL